MQAGEEEELLLLLLGKVLMRTEGLKMERKVSLLLRLSTPARAHTHPPLSVHFLVIAVELGGDSGLQRQARDEAPSFPTPPPPVGEGGARPKWRRKEELAD